MMCWIYLKMIGIVLGLIASIGLIIYAIYVSTLKYTDSSEPWIYVGIAVGLAIGCGRNKIELNYKNKIVSA